MNAPKAVPLVVGLLVVAALFVPIYQGATSDETREFMTDAGDWCEDHDGELTHVQSVAHGGLHCALPNGTSVHMSEVVGGG